MVGICENIRLAPVGCIAVAIVPAGVAAGHDTVTVLTSYGAVWYGLTDVIAIAAVVHVACCVGFAAVGAVGVAVLIAAGTGDGSLQPLVRQNTQIDKVDKAISA